MTRAEMEALALRVEREEPSRELDATIWGVSGQFGYFEDFMGGDEAAPRYTTSLDAAASLMPLEWETTSIDWIDNGWEVMAFRSDPLPYKGNQVEASAPSEPRARTAAAIRAIAQEMPE
jgi:hypothetical protein